MPYGFGWKFSANSPGRSGVCSDGSAWSAPKRPAGSQVAFMQWASSATCTFTALADGAYIVTFWAAQRGYVKPQFDMVVEVDGRAVKTVAAAQLSTSTWKLFTADVTLQPGPHTLRFRGLGTAKIDCTGFVDDVGIMGPDGVPVFLANPGFESPKLDPGSYIDNPPEVSTPGFRLDACVMASGRTLYGRFVNKATGVAGAAVPGGSAGAVVLDVNGSRVPLDPAGILYDADHDGFLWRFPVGVEVRPGDTVSLTAPEAWASTANDYAEAMEGMPVMNCAGRPAWAVPEKARLSVGLDMGNLGSPYWSTYSLTRNLRHRMQFWDQNAVNGADARWYPTSMTANRATATFMMSDKPNFLDGTGMPAPSGLYAIGWRSSSPTTFGIYSSKGLTVTERVDLANTSGPDKVRVFEVKGKPGSSAWTLSFEMVDTTRKPAIDYMVIYGPGDFAYTDNHPVVLENPTDELQPSSVFLDRVAGGVGTLRFGDCLLGYGGTDCCEPEHLLRPDRFSWYGWYNNRKIPFVRARPFDAEVSPYVYSPLFGEQYPATLGVAIPEAPAGSITKALIPDAAEAPVIEGQVLEKDGERMRVLNVEGDGVTFERGSEGTTPVAHDVGPILVSSRLKVNSIADFKAEDNWVLEFQTQAPHGLRTLQQPTFPGDQPWPALTFADGSKWAPARSSQGVFVTGATTFVVAVGKPGSLHKPNIPLAAPVEIDPAKCFMNHNLHENFSYPHAFCAALVGRLGCDAVVNIPIAASDSYVDAVAKNWRDATKPGQTIWLEYINEPWNWSYIGAGTQSRVNWLLHKIPDGQFTWQVRRTGQMVKRFKALFGDRAADVRGFLNMQQGSSANVDRYVKQCLDEGLPVLDFAVAPYTLMPATAAVMRWLESSDAAQAVDAWTWNLRKGISANRSGPIPAMAGHRAAVNAANAKYGTACKLLGYECGIEMPWPAYYPTLAEAIAPESATLKVTSSLPIVPLQYLRVGDLGEWIRVDSVQSVLGQYVLQVTRGMMGTTPGAYAAGTQLRNAHAERGRDLVYHPLFRLAQMEEFQLWQDYFDQAMISIYCGDYVRDNTGVKLWSMYHHMFQKPGRGDGRDGGVDCDNTACLAQPGLADSKDPNENQDATARSVRGHAFLDWNRWARCNKAKGGM